jgi:hypothetical protein
VVFAPRFFFVVHDRTADRFGKAFPAPAGPSPLLESLVGGLPIDGGVVDSIV